MRMRRIAALAMVAAAALAAGLAGGARAQPPPFAGLVVQMGDGTVHTFCLPLDGAGTTGERLLRQSGLALAADATPLGTLVCRIEDDGCAWPAESCWCQCRLLSGDCRYWAYSTLESGAWRYSVLGAGARAVQPGDVDGWAWGPGQLTRGAAPPVVPFETLCRDRLTSPGGASDSPGPREGRTTATTVTTGFQSAPATPRRQTAPTSRTLATEAPADTRGGAETPPAGQGGTPSSGWATPGATIEQIAHAPGAATDGPAGGHDPSRDGAAGGGAPRRSQPEPGTADRDGGAAPDRVASDRAPGDRSPAIADSPEVAAPGGTVLPGRRGIPVSGLVAFLAVGSVLLSGMAWAWRRR